MSAHYSVPLLSATLIEPYNRMVILTALKDKEAWMSLIVLDLTSLYTSCQRELEYVPIHIRNENFSDPFFYRELA